MVAINVTPRVMSDGTKLITYSDTVGTTKTTYTFANPQESMTISNKGLKTIIYSVGTKTNVQLKQSETHTFKELFSSFEVQASEGVQQFEILTDEEGTEGSAGNGAIASLDSKITSLSSQMAQKLTGIEVTTNAQTDGKNTTFGHSTNAIAGDVSTSVILGGGSTGYNNVIGGDGANVNTTSPNTTTTGTGAHVSVVGGYDNSAGSLSSKIISDHSKTEVGGAGHNAIYGGANHVIKSTASFAMIAGGQNNEVSGQGGFATGQRNKVGGTGSACFGYDNTLTANGTFANGAAHTVSGLYSQASGSTNTAAANFSKAEGNYAHTRTVGQQTLATGRFAALGDAQTSVIEMYKQTTDAITTTLGMLQSTTSHQLLPNQSVVFTVLLVARVVGGTDTAAWEIKGCYRRGATGTPIAVGSPIITQLGADTGATAWTAAMSADSAGGLNVRITGEAGKTIRWVQRMTLVEVMV